MSDNTELARNLRIPLATYLMSYDTAYDANTYTITYLGGTVPGATTYTLQTGAYVRVGALVVATGTVVWTAASGTGNAQISLPFAAANVTNQFYSGSVRVDSVTFANGSPEIIMSPNTSFFSLVTPITNAASPTLAVEAAGNIVFTVSYFAT